MEDAAPNFYYNSDERRQMQGPRSKLLVKTSDKDAIACKRANKQLVRHKRRAKNNK